MPILIPRKQFQVKVIKDLGQNKPQFTIGQAREIVSLTVVLIDEGWYKI